MSERWSSGQAKRPFPTNMAIWVSHFSVWMIERIIQWNEFLKTVEPHFCSCPFPNCYKTFLVHQRAWTCRYIPPLLLCSFATYLLHHLQCFDISGKVQHVSTLNESLSNCQRPEHLSFEVARWVVFQGFLAEGHSIFRLHFGIQDSKLSTGQTSPPTKIGEDLEPEGNSERICRSFPKTLAMPGVSGWRQRTGLPTFPGEKKPRANEFLKRFLIFYLFANWEMLQILEP